VPGVDSQLLQPEHTWQDPQAYQEQVKDLCGQFIENFKKFDVPEDIIKAGPQL